MNSRHGVRGVALVEYQIGISAKSSDNVASWYGRDMIANFEARLTAPRVGYKALIVCMKEGLMGDLISRHKVEEGF